MQFAAAPSRRTAVALAPPSANSSQSLRQEAENAVRQNCAGRSLCRAEARNCIRIVAFPAGYAARVIDSYNKKILVGRAIA